MTSKKRLNTLLKHLAPSTCLLNATKASGTSEKKVALIVGAGDGLGGSIVRKFAKEGFITIACRRNGNKTKKLVDKVTSFGGICHGYTLDVRKEDEMIKFVSYIEDKYGAIEVAVFNPGVNVRFNVVNTTSRVYRKVWEMGCFGGFLFGREVAKKMLLRNRGTIIFTGATSSLRGNAGFSAFSGSKQALKALAQCMAKELGPKNIHVAHIIVDGGIDGPFIRNLMKDSLKHAPQDSLLSPDEIAINYWNIYKQHRSSWTFEMDVRFDFL